MARRFREHFLRRVHHLDGVWDFAFLGNVDAETVEPSGITYDDVMAVPGCFDATPRYAGRRGLGAYRIRVPVARAGTLRWVIRAAHHRAKLFADGRVLCGHGGGFSRFHADFALREPGEVELVALVDNRFDAQRSPLHHEKFDGYQYGGLTRGAELHELPSTHVTRLEFHTLELEGPTVELLVAYRTDQPGKVVPFRVTFDGAPLLDTSIRLELPRGSLKQRFTLPGVALWSPEHPALHLLGVQLDQDDQFERVGLRTVRVAGKALLLNERPVRLIGTSRLDAYPGFGHAVPHQAQVSDLQLIQKVGFNFIRGAHHPHDEGFLDLCDELGVLVSSEAIGWQHGIEDLRNGQFVDSQLQHVDEMITSAINHPSVILWGLLNESASSEPDARPTYSKLIGHVRARDPSRPVTFVSNRHGSDRCLDLVDLVSISAHPGWHFGELDTLEGELEQVLEVYRRLAPDKPLLLAEIGAGALYGLRDHHGQRWTEDYQVRFLERVLAAIRTTRHDLIGVCFWQFCDTRSTESLPTALGRPRGFDNRGLFDEYRRPKLAALTLERLLAGDVPPTRR